MQTSDAQLIVERLELAVELGGYVHKVLGRNQKL